MLSGKIGFWKLKVESEAALMIDFATSILYSIYT